MKKVPKSKAFPRSPRFSTYLVLTLFPLLAALGTGLWLSAQLRPAAGRTPADASDARLEEAVTQDKLLQEAFWLSVDRLRTEARAFAATGSLQGLGTPARAAFELTRRPEGGLAAARRKAGDLSLEALSRGLDLRMLRDNSVATLRGPGKLVGFGFEAPDRASVIVTWFEAQDAFGFFERWGRRSRGGQLQGYVVDQEGEILAAGSDTPARNVEAIGFEGAGAALRSLGQGVLSGAQAGDKGSMAYSRLGTLPWATFATRADAAAAVVPALSRWVASPVFAAGAQGLIFLLAFYFVFSLWVRRLWVRYEESDAGAAPPVWVDLSGDWASTEPAARARRAPASPSTVPLITPTADHDHTV